MNNYSKHELVQRFLKHSGFWIAEWLPSVLTLVAFFLLQAFPKEFKLYFALTLVLLVILTFFTKKLITAVFIILFALSPFLSPGKYYSFTLIEPYTVQWEGARESGMIEAYGIVMSDIVILFAVYLAIRLALSARNKQKKTFPGKLLPRITITSWVFYAVMLLASSLYISPYPLFSTVTAFQFLKLVLGFVATYYWLVGDVSAKLTLSKIILGLLFSINLLAVNDFTQQVFSLNQNQESRVQTIEEQKLLPRPSSVFRHPNQLAFISTALLFSAGHLLGRKERKSKEFIGIAVLTLLVVLLTQSRSVWLILASIALLSFQDLWKEMRNNSFFKQFFRKRIIFMGIVIFALLIFPRVYYTQYSDDGGSLSIRQRMISEGLSALRESPLIGFGANTNVLVMLQLHPNGYIQHFPFGNHLGYLQIALEAGMFGAIFFFFPWLEMYRQMERYITIRKGIKVDAAIHAMIRGSILLVFVFYLFQPHTGRIDFFFLGILMSTSVWALNNSISTGKRAI